VVHYKNFIENYMTFDDLRLIDPLLRALKDEGYTQPTPIQQQAIPQVAAGKDLLGVAQTGTGKTAAFALPILQELYTTPRPNPSRPGIRVLVLTPTRELAIQIDESFGTYGKHTNMKHTVIFGGVSQHAQVATLRRGVDILTATPGRLLDLMNQGLLRLDTIEIFVLDEADRMLDMGFIHDIRKVIAKLPEKRQSLFFSATMPPEIQKLADTILTNPVKVEVTPASSTVEKIEQEVFLVEKSDKRKLLKHLLEERHIPRVLVFSRTKHGADRVVKDLNQDGIHAEAIHGNKAQNARQRALSNFKSGATRVLVATDIAARGIDIDEITHVINYDLPNEPETYVHRIGRTGRAGREGIALSFCDVDERPYLRDIEKLIKLSIDRATDYPFASNVPLGTPPSPKQKQEGRQRSPYADRSSQGGRSQGTSRSVSSSRSDGGRANTGSPVRADQSSSSRSHSTGNSSSSSSNSRGNSNGNRSNSSSRSQSASRPGQRSSSGQTIKSWLDRDEFSY
jgi:ATP-dependent RNA helicase RhlE